MPSIADFNARDDLDPWVARKLNHNFSALLALHGSDAGVPNPVAMSTVTPVERSEEVFWYNQDTGMLRVWTFADGDWRWVELDARAIASSLEGLERSVLEVSGQVAGLSNRVGQLSSAVDALVSPALSDLPLSQDVEAYDSTQIPKLMRMGRLVNLSGAVRPTSQVAAGGELQIGTLPQRFRPARDVDVLCQGTSRAVWLLHVTPGGSVSASRYRMDGAYIPIPTDAWLTFDATFVAA